jgi:hypothetical protein
MTDLDRAICDMLATLDNTACATLEVALNLPERYTSDAVPTLAWWFAPAYNDERKATRCA